MSIARTHPHPAPEQVCILWHHPEADPSGSLIRALTNRGLSVLSSSSHHTVFAAACQCAKSANRVVIVLDGRDSLVGVDRLLNALERFGPGVICWEHCPGMNPPMVPVVQEAYEKPAGAQPVRASKPTNLRLVGDPAQEQPDHPPRVSIQKPTPGRAISSSDVLDADELNALLSGEMGSDRPKS